MVKVGIIGFGFMGAMHFRCYKNVEGVNIVALCDADKGKVEAEGGTAGNIACSEATLDLSGIDIYSDARKMLSEAQLDAVSITLPTYLHAEYAKLALESGINVLCEKPMALNLQHCEQMTAAAKKSNQLLLIGHCIRFWPEYAQAKEIVGSGEYGKVKVASFRRLVSTPGYSIGNWHLDGSKSGGAAMDCHIHDTDFVQYLFGMPKFVCSQAVKGPSGDYDHIVTQYGYDDDCVVTAEGGWMMSPSFGFQMSYTLVLERATIIYDFLRDPSLQIHTAEGETLSPKIASGDGYSHEIEHFIKAVSGQSVPEVTSPEQSMNSIKLILAEKQSAGSGDKIALT